MRPDTHPRYAPWPRYILYNQKSLVVTGFSLGQFGVVYKAHMVKAQGLKDTVTETVAVKILKGKAITYVIELYSIRASRNCRGLYIPYLFTNNWTV